MTTPARDSRAAPGAAHAPGTARWLNAVTTLVVAAAALVVVAAAAPSLMRAGMYASETPLEPAPPVRANNPTLIPHAHPPPRAFDRDREDLDEPPSRLRPGDPRSAPPRFPRSDDDDDGPGFGLGLKGGVTLRPLLLRDRRSGSVLHEVRAGQPVSILREDDEWLLVVHKTDDDIITGWARRSELLLR